jgi:ATP-dependent protease HslVU (ClpYQ) peptidase subunit
MTICIAAKYDGGIVLASDSRITAGDSTFTLGELKGFNWQGLEVLYAGPLYYVQQLQRQPIAGYTFREVESFQQLMWDFPPDKKDRGAVEFLVVNETDMYIVSGWGDVVRQNEDYAVIGSEFGWVAMDLEYPKIRNRTLYNTKKKIARVMRVVARRDNTVGAPFYYEELP